MTASGFTNVAEYLPEIARTHPHTRAVVFPHSRDRFGRVAYTHLTFKQLDEESNRIASGLEKLGIRRGTRTTLMVTPSIEFFALTFALFKVGAVIVMVDPGIGVKNLKKCLAEAAPEAFIGIPKAHAARVILGWGRESVRTLVTVGPRLFWGGHSLEDVVAAGSADYAMAKSDPAETAAILFTSGSTGVPKGAVYSHGVFIAQVAILRDEFGILPGEIDVPTFPLFALFDAALGMTAIIPDMDATRPGSVDPKKIIEAVVNQGATNMFGSPALIDRVSRYGAATGAKLPTLRRVLSAGAPVSPMILKNFRAMLPDDAKVYTPYGATESLPVAAVESREILGDAAARTDAGEGICIGTPMEHVRVRIIKISDEAIEKWHDALVVPDGEVGEICVRGPIVTESYYKRPDLTALAKIRDADGAIWHRMGDLGKFDERGRMWFCGRKSHRVITSNGTMFTDPTEGIFNAHPKVRRTALVGAGARPNQTPVLCIELEAEHASADREAILRELRVLAEPHEVARRIQHFLFHSGFPVDIRHNAKIGRELLAVWATEQLKGKL